MEIYTLNVLIESIKNNLVFDDILIAENRKDKKIVFIKNLCREKKINYKIVPSSQIDKRAGKENQGVFAKISPVKFYSTDYIIENAKKGLILILDKINDTGNLGAIIRTAASAEIDGIIIPERNSAPINETVLKTSAGGLLKVKISKVKNLNSELQKLKNNGYWIASTVMDGKTDYYDYDFKYKTAIIMGNEHNGVSELLKKNSDYLLTIPHSKNVESLNVSVATSIIVFEALRQRAVCKK